MKRSYFPWRLFWKVFISLVILLNLLNIFTLGFGSYIFDFSFFEMKNLYFSLSFFGLSLVGAGFFSYRFSLPMKRVILKAIRMANKQLFFQLSESDLDEDMLFESEPGEYFELEQALDQIRKKYKMRKEQLAHEREEAQALMLSIEDGVVNIGPEGKLLYFNSGFATHFLNEDQVKNLGQVMISNVIRDTEVIQAFDEIIKTGNGQKLVREMNTLIGDHPRYFSITISPLKDPKTKEIFGALGIFHDITEFKRLEKIRMEFVENASHELRTPLTSIKGYLDTLNEDIALGRFEQTNQFVKIISRNVNRLIELVNDLLTLSSLERSNSIDINLVSTDKVTSDVVERYIKTASEKNIKLKYTTADVKELSADPLKVEQVLENLIGNAIKYGNQNGQVDIKWYFDHGKKLICLSVKDDGPGIPKEHLSRIFERFYRVDKSRSREVGGTGLGLSIVKHIMLIHNGFVQVKSEVGSGCEFICCFPI